MERNVVERAISTEIDTRTEQKRVDKFGWFMSKIQIATSPPREDEPAGTNGKEDDEIRTLLSGENNLRQPSPDPSRSSHPFPPSAKMATNNSVEPQGLVPLEPRALTG